MTYCPPIRKASAKEFHAAISGAKSMHSRGWMVDVHSMKDYSKNYKMFMTSDGKSGIAVHKKSGNVVSVFNTAGGNRLAKLIPMAIMNGGRRLDCFADGLERLYGRHGAKISGRIAFSADAAPSDWDRKSRPDVVMMTLPTSLRAWTRQYDINRVTNVKRHAYDKDWDSMDAKTMKAMKTRLASERKGDGLALALGGGK